MPRRKVSLRKTRGLWTVVIPAFGFTNADTVQRFLSFEGARRWLSGELDRADRGAASGARSENAGNYVDGISEIPRWEPFRRGWWR